ncbi:translation initiation factor IF-2, partial [Anaerotruncus colihominis]
MIEKYRLHEVAKDLGVASKEVVDLLAERIPGERKSMTALNEQELSVVLNHYTNQNQVESFDEYFAAGEAKKQAAKEAARKAAEQARAAAQEAARKTAEEA